MAKEIVCNVLKVINEVENNRGIIRLQVVQWNNFAPTLEKREYYYDDNSEEKAGKAKGLTLDDINLILDNADEIKELMEK